MAFSEAFRLGSDTSLRESHHALSQGWEREVAYSNHSDEDGYQDGQRTQQYPEKRVHEVPKEVATSLFRLDAEHLVKLSSSARRPPMSPPLRRRQSGDFKGGQMP
jgi:hypothetical protein